MKRFSLVGYDRKTKAMEFATVSCSYIIRLDKLFVEVVLLKNVIYKVEKNADYILFCKRKRRP